ncbi:type II toxin-antitoxin system PemK/MazF family toxin [Candidatus Halobeggiatoa sp. HSG11]|nr:type II toxin-antitoxin system PemK/MazF family toxin [Candidatus Halobeggiatoa sp. HSG11]
MSKTLLPSRGEIWLVNLNPTRGHEQAGIRPALIVSVDIFNHGPADLIVVLPITTKNKKIPLHVKITPPEGGLKELSFIKCEDIRSISTERLLKQLGNITDSTLILAEDKLRILIGL